MSAPATGPAHGAILAAIRAVLTGDAAVTDTLGDRVFDRVPDRARTPYATFGPLATTPLDAEGTHAHQVEIEVWSRGRGRREAAEAMASVAAALDGAEPAIPGHRTVDCRVATTGTDAKGLDLHRASLSLRLVTEPL